MFQLGAIAVVVFNALVWLALRKRLVAAFPRRGKWVALSTIPLLLILLHPSMLMAVGGWSGMRGSRGMFPEWFQMFCVAAQFGWIFYGLMLAPFGAWRLMLRLRALARRDSGTPLERRLADSGRRRMITSAALIVPAAAMVLGGGSVLASRVAPSVTRIRLRVPRDMTSLHGVTIAQCSDVHVGSYMDRERLAEVRDAMNATGADYHVVTGDLVDNHVSQMELATEFLRELKPRREAFQCMGNHEYIAARSADVKTIVSGLHETGASMLIDEAREIRVGSDRFWMGGIDYPRNRDQSVSGRDNHRDSLLATLAQMSDDGAPRIVLSHHPRAFFDAREMQLDLMLSGHTHGGQIKLGRVGDAALTPILPLDYYHNGHYQHEGRNLYVNAGAGGWLPVRINCPPEITLIELVSA